MKKYLAEMIGTMVLVLMGCGTAVSLGCTSDNPELASTVVGTALAFGLVIVAMAYSIGNISGCHINPAVSIAMLVSGKLSFKPLHSFASRLRVTEFVLCVFKIEISLFEESFLIFEFIGDNLCSFAVDYGAVIAIRIFERGQARDHRQQRQHDKVKHYNENRTIQFLLR